MRSIMSIIAPPDLPPPPWLWRFFGGGVDFLDDFGLRGDRFSAGVGLGQPVGGLVHDVLHLLEQLDHLRHGLLDDELLDIGGKFVLLVGELWRSRRVCFARCPARVRLRGQ